MAGIFRSYDIRGIYPDEINEDIVYKIGLALVRLFPDVEEFCVGRDARTSSPQLFSALTRAITESGRDVVDIGLVSTPMAYFASGRYGFGCTVQITASHNPKQYNGMKICREQAIALSYETGIGEIEKLVTSGNLEVQKAPLPGKIRELDIIKDYIDHLLKFVQVDKEIKLVLDASNGAVGPVAVELFRHIPQVKLYPLCVEPDGRFPNHSPDPMKDEAIKLLREKVLEVKADIGAIFDADGDRVMFIDEKGHRISSDMITALIAIEVLLNEPGAHIVYDLRSSKVVPEVIKENGGVPVITRVGHAYIKETMRKHDAPFGGELSGHYYFRDNYFADSGLLALIKVLNIISQDQRPVSQIVSSIRKYHATGEINFKVSDPDRVLAEVESYFSQFSPREVMKLDGLTMDFGDWWFNLRKSNTEPLVRLNLEANTEELMREKLRLVEEKIKELA